MQGRRARNHDHAQRCIIYVVSVTALTDILTTDSQGFRRVVPLHRIQAGMRAQGCRLLDHTGTNARVVNFLMNGLHSAQVSLEAAQRPQRDKRASKDARPGQ